MKGENKWSKCKCLVVDKQLEGLVNFIIDILCLHLLKHQFGDDGVNPEDKGDQDQVDNHEYYEDDNYEDDSDDHFGEDDNLPEVKFLYSLLAVLGPGLGGLQPLHENLDLLLVLLLPLLGLLLRHLTQAVKDPIWSHHDQESKMRMCCGPREP